MLASQVRNMQILASRILKFLLNCALNVFYIINSLTKSRLLCLIYDLDINKKVSEYKKKEVGHGEKLN